MSNQSTAATATATTSSDNDSTTDFHNKNHWENKVKFMEHSKIFLDFYASDLIQRSIDLYFNNIITNNTEKEPQSVSILDVATGTGLIPFKFVDENIISSKYGNHLVISSLNGIDFAPNMIEGAEFKKQSRIQDKIDSNWNEKLKFQVMDGQDLKFQDESFDIVYSNMGVLFYPKIVQGLSEIKRVLKKGGMAFLNAWTPDFPTRVSFNTVFDVLKENPNEKDDRFSLPVFSLSNPEIFHNYCKQCEFEQVEIKQVTQTVRMKYSELKSIINMGAQFVGMVQKYLKENPHLNSSENELLERIEKITKEKFNIQSDDEDIQIVTSANVAILTK